MIIKAGYKTSEFWFTLVSFIFSGLYLTGVLKENDQKEQLITIVSHAVESVILISGQMFIFYRYIKGRNEVKKIAEQERLNNKIKIEKEETDNDAKRVDNSRSRKTTSRNKTKSTKSKKRSPK